MATITFPSEPAAQSMSWRLVQPSQTNISSWTGARQTLAFNRGWWECDYALPPIVGTLNILAWRSFIAKAQGSANDFQVPVDPVAQTAISSTVLTNGVNQTGRSIATDGWPATTAVLLAGQFVTINNQLLQVRDNVISNSSGQATIQVEPPVRQPVADNTAVEYRNPYCLMYITEMPSLSVEAGYVYNVSFSLRESF